MSPSEDSLEMHQCVMVSRAIEQLHVMLVARWSEVAPLRLVQPITPTGQQRTALRSTSVIFSRARTEHFGQLQKTDSGKKQILHTEDGKIEHSTTHSALLSIALLDGEFCPSAQPEPANLAVCAHLMECARWCFQRNDPIDHADARRVHMAWDGLRPAPL